MEFSLKLYTMKSRWSIVHIEGSQVIISKKYCIYFFKDQFCLSKQCTTLMKCCIVRLFIRVYIVCQSTRLGVSGLQRVIGSNRFEAVKNCYEIGVV